ncbi:MAG: hypothetical protein AB7P40_01000 [Chloroflexota bacterium]
MERQSLHQGQPTVAADDNGYSAAAQTWRPLVQAGMYVAGLAGDTFGQVKETRPHDFLVESSGTLGAEPGPLLYLPYERIHVMLADKITLDVPSSQVEEYATPPSSYTL